MYQCFITVIKYGTSSGVYELNHECDSMSDFITRTRMSTHKLLT